MFRVRRDEDKQKRMVWRHHQATRWDLDYPHWNPSCLRSCTAYPEMPSQMAESHATQLLNVLSWQSFSSDVPRTGVFVMDGSLQPQSIQKSLRVAGTPNLPSTSASNLIWGSVSLPGYSGGGSYKPCVCVGGHVQTPWWENGGEPLHYFRLNPPQFLSHTPYCVFCISVLTSGWHF